MKNFDMAKVSHTDSSISKQSRALVSETKPTSTYEYEYHEQVCFTAEGPGMG